ncbi:tRNA threonylcarbamoyl adenosine modification protein, Sua5/YciO/YrdC/YwlC family [Halorientalis persicus]|jgi:L-threonylcarbamoyladenylate synthase|uniref:L-threonylcarbamoyladenylate synthase n=1 Tax=Halorientalis persicus TaxID=1367881 RepID=A0A1H8CV35_9EURY|nr:L-threonylcarbamoyladenylate synthase [Halorientalis persicus]SEM98840.1 tRNA threonylcarbamoyl adenosine modification protein, Sua5/YciO/YrdC/YwlC family [Halorientalis persicus]
MDAPVLEPTSGNLRRAADCIADGGVVVAPSDTNLALTVDPWQDEPIERVYEMTDRPPEKPLTMFVRDPETWRTYGTHENPELAERFVEAFWPGPLNLVLRATDAVPHERVRKDGTVAIGCLSNPTWRELASHLDRPVAMTSANRAGEADDRLVDLAFAREQVGANVDYLIEGGPRGTTESSTILDLSGEPSVLRHGDVTVADLNRVADVISDGGGER